MINWNKKFTKAILFPLTLTIFFTSTFLNITNLPGEKNNFVSAKTNDDDKPLVNFMVVSDVHGYLTNLKNAINDAKNNNCSAIMLNGDLTDKGYESQYDSLVSTVNENVKGSDIKPYYVTGNHDLRWLSGGYEEGKNKFLTKTKMPNMYYDQWINGYHFIFLSSEQDLKDQAYLSDTQLDWLNSKLSEDSDSNKPVFVFLHQALVKTVSDSYPQQGYDKSYPDGAVQDKELRNILNRYPQSILITGHTHASITSSLNFLPTPTFKMINGGGLTIGQGLLFNVYKDKVVINGRDFSGKKTIANWTINYGAPSTPLDTNSYYTIKNLFSGKLMDIRGEYTSDGTDIIQYSSNNGQNQQWKFVDAGNGYYKIVSRLTGKVVCVTDGSLDNKAKLSQATDTGADNQLWKFVDLQGGVYKIINKKSGKQIDVPGSSTSNSTILIQYDNNESPNQLWNITKVQ